MIQGFIANCTVWFVIICIIIGGLLVLGLLWKYGMKYRMTAEEAAMKLHGDDWIKPNEKKLRYDAGVTLECTAENIWPYIRQMGQNKAGWYSFDWLERLFTFDIHNHYTIHPEWQRMEIGDYQWFHQAPLSIGEWITDVDHEKHYFAAHSDSRTDKEGTHREKAFRVPGFNYFCWTWNWQVYDIGEKRCRLIWRCDCTFAPWNIFTKAFVVIILGTASVVMGRNCMDVLKKIAEGSIKIERRNT